MDGTTLVKENPFFINKLKRLSTGLCGSGTSAYMPLAQHHMRAILLLSAHCKLSCEGTENTTSCAFPRSLHWAWVGRMFLDQISAV